MKKLLLTLTLLTMVAFQGFAQSANDEKETLVDEVIGLVFDDNDLELLMQEQMAMVSNSGALSREKVAALTKEMLEAMKPATLEVMRNTYRSAFSLEELKELKSFYGSPLGQKVSKLWISQSGEMTKAFGNEDFQRKMMQIFNKYLQ